MADTWKILTVTEVARELEVAAETVRAWEKSGRLHVLARTAAGTRLFLKSEVERFAKSRSQDVSHNPAGSKIL